MTKAEFYKKHTNCPKCNSGNVIKTDKKVKEKSPFVDDLNDANCTDCGWKGKLKNLVPSQEVQVDEQIEKTYIQLSYTPVLVDMPANGLIESVVCLPAIQVIQNLVHYNECSIQALNNQDLELTQLKAAVGYSDEDVNVTPSKVNQTIAMLYQGIVNNEAFANSEDEACKFLVKTAKDSIESLIYLMTHANTRAIIMSNQFTNDNSSIIAQYMDNLLDVIEQNKPTQDDTTTTTTDSSPRLSIVKD